MLSIQLTAPAISDSPPSVFSPTHCSPVYPFFRSSDTAPSIPDIAFALLSPQHSPLLTTKGNAVAASKRIKPLKIVVSQRKSSVSSQSSSMSKAPGAIHVHPNALPSFQANVVNVANEKPIAAKSPRLGPVDHDATPTQTPRTARPLKKRHDLLMA